MAQFNKEFLPIIKNNTEQQSGLRMLQSELSNILLIKACQIMEVEFS